MVRRLGNSIAKRWRSLRVRKEFDAAFYLRQNPDVAAAGINPYRHFMEFGWKERRDPSSKFSVSYYLEQNGDIAEAEINPLLHYVLYGRKEQRRPSPAAFQPEAGIQQPLVSVIVPNYNHARFLPDRLSSILQQTYRNMEVIVLDDASTDESLDVVNEFRESDARIVNVIANEKNSGSVFRQWQKGVEAARGELIWICESDDTCELDFLARIVPLFADRSVMIGFGRVQFADADGVVRQGLDGYRERAEPGIWNAQMVRSARDWFTSAFAAANVIPNVGGCVFRNAAFPQDMWQEAANYKVLGDWILYVRLAAGGRIAFEPAAVSYFRQHGSNTSVKSFQEEGFYREHGRCMEVLRATWGTPREPLAKMYDGLVAHQKHLGLGDNLDLTQLVELDRVLQVERSSTHVLVGMLGFHLGGGELFPVRLANELIDRGYLVSMLVLETKDENAKVRDQLDRRIPVYHADIVREMGAARFLRSIGADIVHTHFVGIDSLLGADRLDVPYVATLHGSYEACGVGSNALLRILRNVDHWVYLTPRNLNHLDGIPISRDAMSTIPNGIPAGSGKSPLKRCDLGIGDEDLVFMVASRAIKPKGWEQAIDALRQAQHAAARKLHLVFCGDGEEYERLSRGSHRNVHFLGFQENVGDIYPLADCAVLPTRFEGESQPLTLMEAMQVGIPVISTDIGDIRNMTHRSGRSAGIVVPPEPDDALFAGHLAGAMLAMADDAFRQKRAKDARHLGKSFDLESCVDQYVGLYEWLIDSRAERLL